MEDPYSEQISNYLKNIQKIATDQSKTKFTPDG